MNTFADQNDKLNVNNIKNINEYDCQDGINTYVSERNPNLHGRKPIKIRFYANGDKFFSGKKISIYSHKYQNIDELMSELTSKMPHHVHLPNGIRQLFTTSSGKRIHEIKELKNGKDYVCAGNENYKNIAYGKIDKEPWFKGRPQNFSRYPPLLPFGLGPNVDINGIHTSDNQSHYVGRNAFPTRFYRPAGQNYMIKNAAGHFVSYGLPLVYPKLIKFKHKPINNKKNNYYQNILSQQSKPKVITIVRNDPEKPKKVVRILLNKRSIQTFETLFSDIENSLRDLPNQKTSEIGKIYNLMGKEIQSIEDFFRNEDFFIAVRNKETLVAKQVKDILHDIYPNHPQINQVLRFWTNEKYCDLSTKKDEQDIDKYKIIPISNLTIDKRDSGFEEQNFSNESEFVSFHTNETTEVDSVLKPKLSNSKPIIKKKSNNRKNHETMIDQIIPGTENQITNIEKMTVQNTNNYSKSIQNANSERLRAAYEDRENARLQLQNQIKLERKKLEVILTNNSNIYSQMIRKSINKRGHIDIFKQMDEAYEKTRKEKIREKMDKLPFTNIEENSISVVKSMFITSEKKLLKNTEHNEVTAKTLSKDNNDENYDISTSLGKLNKINEDPYEYYTEEDEIEKSKRYKDEFETRQRHNNKMTKSAELLQFSELEVIREKYYKNENKENDVNQTSVFNIELDPEELKVNETRLTGYSIPVKNCQNSKIGFSPNLEQEINYDLLQPALQNVSQFKSNLSLNSQSKLDYENKNVLSSEIINDKNSFTVLQNVNQYCESKELKSPIQKLILNKDLPSSSLPGSRIIGKMCRQLPSSDIIYQRFEVTKLLGDGNFAVVKLAFHKKSKTEYALKIIDKARMVGKETMIENEIWIMKLCNHDNIVKLKEEYETKEEVFLVMELVKSGDLFDAITQNVKFSEPVAARMVSDVASALFYLHSRRIVHRDLKPENLMVTYHEDRTINLKLADFGLAMEIKKLIFTVCGTPTYVAPEILIEKGYSLEVDLWALGVITYILLCGFPPFRSVNRDQEQLFELIKSGDFDFVSPYWDKISTEVKDLIKKLLVVERTSRATTIEVLSDKWVMSRGKTSCITNESQKRIMIELEEQATANLEGFQKQKKDLRAILNREIQVIYHNKKSKR